MAAPTLTYAATPVTLPYPVAGTSSRRTYDEARIARRTVAGKLRTSIFYWQYGYELAFRGVARTDYDAIVNLWQTAIAGGGYPTFAFVDVFPTANEVEVGLEIGPLISAAEGGNLWDFDLTLKEVNPR